MPWFPSGPRHHGECWRESWSAIHHAPCSSPAACRELPRHAPRRRLSCPAASAIALVVQIARMSDGTRRITYVSEITGMTGDVVAMQDIFVFEKLGIDVSGRVMGRFKATGVSPKFAERLKKAGITLPASVFEHSFEV